MGFGVKELLIIFLVSIPNTYFFGENSLLKLSFLDYEMEIIFLRSV